MPYRKTTLKALAPLWLGASVSLVGPCLAQAPAAQSPITPKTWAVVVGISKYARLPGGQQLQFAENDALAFTDAIKRRGVSPENVRLLIGTQATTEAIKTAIGDWLARSASETDTVYLFFSGHGYVEKQFGESYLLLAGSDPLQPYGTALSLPELAEALRRRVRARRVLILADLLRRDFFGPESEGAAATFVQAMNQVAASRPGASAVLASSPGEFSREGRAWGGYGVFTRSLLDAMSAGPDRNSDGVVTAEELFDAVAVRVAAETSNKQHPWRSEAGLDQIAMASAETPRVGRNAETGRSREQAAEKPRDAEPTTEKAIAADTTAAAKSGGPEPGRSRQPATSAPSQPAAAPDVVSRRKPPSPDKHVAREPVAKPPNTTPAPAEIRKRDTARNDRPTPSPTKESVAAVQPAASRDTGTRPDAKQPASSPAASASTSSGTSAGKRTPPEVAPPFTRTPPRAAAASGVENAELSVVELEPPPRPPTPIPAPTAVDTARVKEQPGGVTASLPVPRAEAAPSPLPLQIEAAIAAGNLIEPRNASAWDLYQSLVREQPSEPEATRLRPLLADALLKSGRSIVEGEVRADNVSDKVDEFRRAGQLLQRARALEPGSLEAAALERLSAALALVALQFFDEAERALSQMQGPKPAAVENALGLVYRGKFDDWRAERAFKNAIALNPSWAPAHYNLALLLQSRKQEAALEEFERAVSLDSNNLAFATALGDAFFEKQQWQRAAEAYRKAIALKPKDAALHTKLGHALYSQGLKDEANREYQKAGELRTKQP